MPGFHLSSHSVATLLCCCVTAIAGRLPSYLQSKMGDKRKLCALLSNPWLCGGKNDRRTERQVRLFLSFLRELSTGRSRFYRSDLPASLPMPPSPTHRLTMYKINRQAKFQASTYSILNLGVEPGASATHWRHCCSWSTRTRILQSGPSAQYYFVP